MQAAGCEVKRGKHLAFRLTAGKKFIRCDSLGEDYTESVLRERISGERVVSPKQKSTSTTADKYTPRLLIDIQAKMQQGYGEGFRQWATIQNLKDSARTILFLQENGIGSYDELIKKSNLVSAEYTGRLSKIKEVEKRLAEISELQRQIGTYSKTREVYAKYKASKWNVDFYESHRADITLHRTAKKYFDSLELEKFPPMASLKQEYAMLAAERKKLYGGYKRAREEMINWQKAKYNTERILAGPQLPTRSYERDSLSL